MLSKLRVLVDRFVEGMSGVGTAVTISLSETEKVALEDKRYAARLVDLRQVRVDGIDGLAATIEVANVDQLKLSPEARWARTRVVLVRPGFHYLLHTGLAGTQSDSWPVLLVIGYANSTNEFDAQLPDFGLPRQHRRYVR